MSIRSILRLDEIIQRMDRRSFVLGLAGSAFARSVGVAPWTVPLLAIAQGATQPKLVVRLAEGQLELPPEVHAEYERLGWIEGKNIRFGLRSAARSHELPALAEEIVTLKPDLVFVVGTPAALAMKRATRSIPIYFILAADPVENGLVASLARPGGNLTGVYNRLFDSKQLQLIKEMVPRAKLVVYPQTVTAGVAHAARSLGMEMRSIPIGNEHDIDGFLAELARARADAVVVPPFPWLSESGIRRLAEMFLKLKMPAIGSSRMFAEAGGLLVYTPKPVPLARSVQMTDQILRGANPAEMPVESPTEFTYVVNERTANAFGLTIPVSVRLGAHEVIR